MKSIFNGLRCLYLCHDLSGNLSIYKSSKFNRRGVLHTPEIAFVKRAYAIRPYR